MDCKIRSSNGAILTSLKEGKMDLRENLMRKLICIMRKSICIITNRKSSTLIAIADEIKCWIVSLNTIFLCIRGVKWVYNYNLIRTIRKQMDNGIHSRC